MEAPEIALAAPRRSVLALACAWVLTAAIIGGCVPAFLRIADLFTLGMAWSWKSGVFATIAGALVWFGFGYLHEYGHAFFATLFGARRFEILRFRDRDVVGHQIKVTGLPEDTACEAFVLAGGILAVLAVFDISSLLAYGAAEAPFAGIAVAAIVRTLRELSVSEGSDVSRLLALRMASSIRRLPKGQPIIHVSNATVTRAGVTILDVVDFQARTGEIVGILGANGAGKTTLLELCAGLLPESRNARELPPNARVALSVPKPAAMPEATLGEALNYYSLMGGFVRDREIERALGLESLYAQRLRYASTGEIQRLSLVLALQQRADIYLLDEPETGLDVAARALLRSILKRQVERGATVIMTTHFVADAFDLCSHLAMMENGRIVRFGPIEHFEDLSNLTHRLCVWVDGSAVNDLLAEGFEVDVAGESESRLVKRGRPQQLLESSFAVAGRVKSLELESNAIG